MSEVIKYDPGIEEEDQDDQPIVQRPISTGNPLDMPAAQFQAGLDRRGTNRKALIQWVRGELVENVDFGRIKIGGRLSKPSLYKPGAEKICGMLGVIATFPTLHDYEARILEGQALDQLLIRCELLNNMGQVVATGAGSRSVSQDQGDLNKALKMCLKSAMIDATLRLGGLSEVFTQDIEDMPAEAVGGYDAPRNGSADAASDLVPSGKHKGQEWASVPTDYLEWIVANTKHGSLKMGAGEELDRRRRQRDDDDQQAGHDEPLHEDIPY